MQDSLQNLKQRLATIMDLNYASSLLGWDQRTLMPAGGARGRAHQLATLRRLSHEKFTDPEVGDLLETLSSLAEDPANDSDDACLVRRVKRDYDQARCLPVEWVAEVTQARSLAQQVWEQARATNDFALFAPHLARNFEYARQQADFLGYDEHPYDALLDLYEPGMKTHEVRAMFDEIKTATVPLLQAITQSSVKAEVSVLHQPFDEARQEQFGVETVRLFGYDWNRGRQDRTVHPFAINFGRDDVRITTRFYPNYLNGALFGTMHEAGHAMYEQGVDPAFERSPLSRGTSLGMHESQSRLWENLVGRSRGFWNANYGRLQGLFPEQLGAVGLDAFYLAINHVEPSFIRVEADELTYNLHVLLRFELETAMLEGRLTAAELPEAWNDGMQQLLGIRPPTDAQGVLQDTHWSGGMVGYFPTYTLGNVISVQLWNAALAAHPAIPEEIERNEYATLLGWMREHIHRHGRKFMTNELLQRAIGGGVDAKPYLRYLHDKFGTLYQISM